MADEQVRKLEDVECSVLNEDWIQRNQQVINKMGGNPAEVRSPGLKAQIHKRSDIVSASIIYCDLYDSSNGKCKYTNGRCRYTFY